MAGTGSPRSSLPEAGGARASRAARFALTAFLLATFSTVAVHPSPALAATQPEQTVYSMIVAARASRGLSTIPLAENLSAVARKHSNRMAQEGLLFHTPCLSCRISGSVLAENVGVGGTLRRIHRMMMGSAGHRANILGGFNQVGVGVVQKGGRYWVTEVFVA